MAKLNVEAIFNLARLIQTPEARQLYLQQVCGDDAQLQSRVEALLRVHDEQKSFLETPAAKPPPDHAAGELWQRVDAVVRRFETAWQGGTPPNIDDFLPKDGPERLAVLEELVKVDMERRRKTGLPAPAEGYLERYPELAACLHSTRSHDTPPPNLAPPARDPAAELVGTVIAGRYKLLEQIGEGGMGTVWVAEQTQPVRRKVALKLIKAGMDSKSVLARFEAERQALALMDHPNIAKVLDGGTTGEGARDEGRGARAEKANDDEKIAGDFSLAPRPSPLAPRLSPLLVYLTGIPSLYFGFSLGFGPC